MARLADKWVAAWISAPVLICVTAFSIVAIVECTAEKKSSCARAVCPERTHPIWLKRSYQCICAALPEFPEDDPPLEER